MARYQTSDSDSTDFFRWRATWVEDGELHSSVSGEYRTIKNVESGIRYDKRINEKYYPDLVIEHTIQQLVATVVHIGNGLSVPTLVWESIDG